MSSTGRTMGMKRAQDHHQQALNCPRCDSLNTKFCYYNNYSLSQPRHFCKACKRYWTRGGTLRSVPVGGGCRKKKRIKKGSSASDSIPTFLTTNATTNQIGVTSTTADMNPVSYGLQLSNQSDLNLTFPRFSSRLRNEIISGTGYDVEQSHFSTFKTGFSSMGMASTYIDPSNQIDDVMTSATNLSNFSSFQSSASNHYQTMFPAKDLLSGSGLMNVTKEVKLEIASDLITNRVDFGAPYVEPMSSLDSSVYWSSIGAWPYLSNYASSVTSLI